MSFAVHLEHEEFLTEFAQGWGAVEAEHFWGSPSLITQIAISCEECAHD